MNPLIDAMTVSSQLDVLFSALMNRCEADPEYLIDIFATADP